MIDQFRDSFRITIDTSACTSLITGYDAKLNDVWYYSNQVFESGKIYGISGVIFALFILIVGTTSPTFVAVSAVLAGLIAVISLANGSLLCYNTIKSDVRTRTKIKQYIWAVLCIAYTVFIAAMQVYCFWIL